MDNPKYIPINELCERYEIEVSFIRELGDFGLIRIVQDPDGYRESGECIDHDTLADVERMIRLHYDLDINLAGIEAIHHLLERVRNMQRELTELKNRLGNK
jgi:hypothetical protein